MNDEQMEQELRRLTPRATSPALRQEIAAKLTAMPEERHSFPGRPRLRVLMSLAAAAAVVLVAATIWRWLPDSDRPVRTVEGPSHLTAQQMEALPPTEAAYFELAKNNADDAREYVELKAEIVSASIAAATAQ